MVKQRKAYANKFLCPCKKDRNIRNYDIQNVHEHEWTLHIIFWYHHGEGREEDKAEKDIDDALMLEATNLYKSTYIRKEDNNDIFASRKD